MKPYELAALLTASTMPPVYAGPASPLRIACARHRRKPGEPCYGKRLVCVPRELANIRWIREQELAAKAGAS